MIRRQVVVLEIEYDDYLERLETPPFRRPPAQWDWNALADMGGDESVEVIAHGDVLAPRAEVSTDA